MTDRRLLSTQLFHILKPILGLPDTARTIEIVMDGPDAVAIVKMETIASTPLTEDEPPADAGEFYLLPAHLSDEAASEIGDEIDHVLAEFVDGDTGSAEVVRAVHDVLTRRNMR